MAILLRDYVNRPGEHCGSTAMRNLLGHYCGLELSEAMVFGLGAGIDCVYLDGVARQPGVLLFGRGVTMESDAARALGVDYRETPDPDDERAWQSVKAEVEAGRPTMLSGDAFYLDYRFSDVHFPAHRFVLVGFDDEREQALVADRLVAEHQVCSYAALRASRNPPDFVSTYNLWGRFVDTRVTRTMAEACRSALATAARRMTGADPSQRSLIEMMSGGERVSVESGLAGLRALGERLPSWRDRGDLAAVAGYAANCIEKYGTGGGNFRNLYASFLREARALVPELVTEEMPELATRSAGAWTRLAGEIGKLAGDGDDARWRRAGAAAAEILEHETRLFESLAGTAADS